MNYFLARQPIFDTKMKVIGYKLYSRSGFDHLYHLDENSDHSSSQVITKSFFLIGINSLTDGKRAFIHFTRNLLINDMVSLIPPELVAIEIRPDIKLDEKVLATCRRLKQAGYFLVLDNFLFQPKSIPLLDYVKMVKIDFNKTTESLQKTIVNRLKPSGIGLIMKNVDSTQAYRQSSEIGFDYFQGDFFRKPFLVAGRDLPAYKMNYLQILKEIQQPEIDLNRLEAIIKSDLSLSYKLLRLINSAAFGFLAEIKSIRQALVMLGNREIKKWITLLALSHMGEEKSEELVHTSLLRARFAESFASLSGKKEQGPELFLMGLFSLIDALMDQPFYAVLEDLPLTKEVKGALMGGDSPLRQPYELLLAFEQGDWNTVSAVCAETGIPEKQLPDHYLKSLEWVKQIYSAN
ncbi:MAG: HDOD domain-containing protein [Calditrichia bacterium]